MTKKTKREGFRSYLTLTFMVGVILGSKLPPGFFRPWYEDGNYYGGELVVHKKEKPRDVFYSLCKQGKVVYVYDQANVLVKWSGCEAVDQLELRSGFLDLHSKENLEKL